jgi:hypothetical protein
MRAVRKGGGGKKGQGQHLEEDLVEKIVRAFKGGDGGGVGEE